MRVLVTGGGGFLGTAIAAALTARGAEVRSFSRASHPHLAASGIEHVRGDIADPGAVRAAAAGCEVVFHTAAVAGIWGRYRDYHRVNVVGTENVLAACRAQDIGKLIYTSTPSVVYSGGNQEGIDERTPYPRSHLAHYGQTKAVAERLVLDANGPGLSTVALRPHLIWGPGDPHLLPRMVARARAGRLVQIGRVDHLVDTTYIDTAAQAHLQVSDVLEPGAAAAGKAYFVSQGEPRACWQLINAFLAAAGAPQVTRSIPVPVAYAAGASARGGLPGGRQS